jgi:type I restriction enzyme, S subunit
MDWPSVPLGDVIDVFDSKRVPLSSIERAKRPGPYPYFGAAQVFDYIDDFIFDGEFILMGEDGSVVRKNGTPFVQYASGRFWANNHTHVLRPHEGAIDFWFLKSALETTDISGFVTGAAQPKLNQSNMRRIPIQMPPRDVQVKIGRVAHALASHIENNKRVIKVLEEIARAIYREWFVEFRFPGCQTVALTDSRLGLIPKEWTPALLAEIAQVNARTLKDVAELGEIEYVDIGSVSTGQINETVRLASEDAPGRARRLVTEGDVIWSTVRPNRRSYALILDPLDNLVVSTGFAVLTPKDVPSAFLYRVVTTEEFIGYLVNRATGAAYPAVTGRVFEEAPVLLPPKALVDRFADFVAPMDRLASNLMAVSDNLQTTRDLLLPRLTSGQLDVSDLDIEHPGLVA